MVFEELYVEKVEENEIILTTIKNGGKLITLDELSDYRNLERIVFKFDLFKEKISY